MTEEKELSEADRGYKMMRAATHILQALGEYREGTFETPERFARAAREIWAGYGDPPNITTFDAPEIPVVIKAKDIEIYSTCEHHLLPMFGTVDIEYMPDEFVCGLSKLARVVYHFGRRLQIQERLTAQIAHFLSCALSPRWIRVRVTLRHLCMQMRGIRDPLQIVTTEAYIDKEVRSCEDVKVREV